MNFNSEPGVVKLPRASMPEEVGVDSSVVMSYVNEIEKRGYKFDSLMVLRHGKVAAEFVWRPYDADIPHDMYSFSKTMTATAIGFAIDEGLLSLDTKIYSFFPEKYAELNGAQKDYADQMNIHSLLTMRSGKRINMFKDTAKMDWTENYMGAKFKCAPCTKWDYVSENIYMLAKILTIVTGQSLTEYLTPRLYEPLEMGVPKWETDPEGIEAGGWGLQLTTEQMAKFSLLYLQNGIWNGKRILPEKWIKACTKKHIDLVPCMIHDGTGYGYQVWLNDNPSYLRFDGLFGQISVMFKDYDACVVFNAADTREYEYIKMIFDYFPKAFGDDLVMSDENYISNFKAELERKSYDWSPAMPRNEKAESEIDGKRYRIKPRDNASVLGVTSYFMWSKKPGKMEYIEFDFSKDVPQFIWKEANSPENRMDIGMNGDFAYSNAILADIPVLMASQGSWLKDNKFKLNIHPLGRSQNRQMVFSFNGKSVKINSKANMNAGDLLVFRLFFAGMNVSPALKNVIGIIIKIANEIWFDPNLKGTLE